MFCVNCGKQVPDDSIFCPECGVKQDSISAANQVQPEPSVQPEPVQAQPEPLVQQEPVQVQAGMKICVNCDIQIPADSRFCPACRSSQPNVQNNTRTTRPPLTPEQKTKFKKRNMFIGIGAGVVAIILVAIYLVTVLVKPTMKLNDYVEIQFSGYDTVGTASVIFDEEAFVEEYGDRVERNTDQEYSASDLLYECISGSLDKESGLSNRDTVTYSWHVDEDTLLEKYGYKVKYEDIVMEVSGLEKVAVFDPFDGLEVSFDGIAPCGTATVSGKCNDEAGEGLEYEFSEYDGLSNGDTVTLNVSSYYEDPITYCIENYGKIPSPLEKTYTVKGLNSYVTASNQLSELSITQMDKQAHDVYLGYIAQKLGEREQLVNFDYIGNYMLVNKNTDDYGSYDDFNIVYMVYKVAVRNYFAGEDQVYDSVNTTYWYISFNNLLVDDAGNVTVDISDYETPDNSITIDSGIGDGWWGNKTWYYRGYDSLEGLYNDVVTANLAMYEHEDNVDDSKATAEETVVSEDGIIFPDSDTKAIKKKDIKALSDDELRYAINEIYARHGYKFKDETLATYYEKYDWYKGKEKSDKKVRKKFNKMELKNVGALQKERDKRKK